MDNQKSGGLKGGFTDVSIHQTIYSAHLLANVGPKWKTEAEIDKVFIEITSVDRDQLSTWPTT